MIARADAFPAQAEPSRGRTGFHVTMADLATFDALLAAQARARENGAVCLVESRFLPRFLDRREADEAHRARERARRNGKGRSRAAGKRHARHLERCPWCWT